MKFPSLKNQKGESLVGVMIAVAVGAVVLIASLAIIDNMMSVQSNLKAKAESEDVMSGVRLAFLGNPANCKLNFPNTPITGLGTINLDPNTSFKYSDQDGNALTGDELIAVGRNYQGVSVTYMNFVVKQPLAASLYGGSLQVGFKPTGGGVDFMREIPITFALDAAGRVINCGPTGGGGGVGLSGSCAAGNSYVMTDGSSGPYFLTLPEAPLTYAFSPMYDMLCTCSVLDLAGATGWRCTYSPAPDPGNSDAADTGF